MEKLGYLLLAGITNGSVYGLVGLSLSIIYGSSRVINFAQGDFVMLGAMSAVMFVVTAALPWPLAMVATIVTTSIVALALDYLVYRPLARRKAPPLTIMMGTLGAAIVIYGAALLVWGPDQQFVPAIFSLDPLSVGPLVTNSQQLAIIGAFALFLLATWFVLYRTRLGLSIRATGVNSRVALLMGIRSERIIQFSFLFSALISSVSGVLVGPLLGVRSDGSAADREGLHGGDPRRARESVRRCCGRRCYRYAGGSDGGLWHEPLCGTGDLPDHPVAAIRPSLRFARGLRGAEAMSAKFPPPRQASIYPAFVVLAVGAGLPYVLHGGFQLRLAMLVWIYAILCMGLNLLYGYAGQISLGQQTFFAIGAYAFALLQIKALWPAPLAFLASLVVCAAVALALGVPLLRLRSHYLAMATLAFALIFFGVTTRWIDFTGGSTGLAAPPLKFAAAPLGRMPVYYLVLVFAGAALLLHDFVARGAVGRALQAIRDDETGAAALGVDVTRYKLRIFVLAAVFAGLPGSPSRSSACASIRA